MREFYARAAEPKELVVIDGADHLFDGKVSDVADAIEDSAGRSEFVATSVPPSDLRPLGGGRRLLEGTEVARRDGG